MAGKDFTKSVASKKSLQNQASKLIFFINALIVQLPKIPPAKQNFIHQYRLKNTSKVSSKFDKISLLIYIYISMLQNN